MSAPLTVSHDSVVVIYHGGRLPTWHDLTPEQRKAYEQEHVDRMLSVAQQHRLMRLEGFKLIAPQRDWVRTWLIEFPTLKGAEAWIAAEMAPPYGRYGYYEYHLARRWAPGYFADWIPDPPPVVPLAADPHHVPPLQADRNSIAVLLWGKWRPEASGVSEAARGDDEHNALMKSIAREHKMMRIEGFALFGPQADYHRFWVMEFPTLDGAEAWIEGETRPPHGRYALKAMQLARRWAPEYFASWVAR